MSAAPQDEEIDLANTRSTHFAVLDDFLDPAAAAAMRAGVDSHFGTPHRHTRDAHQIWNYWHVPDAYTYLRTSAERVIAPAALAAFTDALSRFAAERLGLTGLTAPPLISVYVNGCHQSFHNDSHNGRFAFVYSLTRPQRSFTGGETLIWHDSDYFADSFTQAHGAFGLYDAVAPAFNRLVLFDDRMPHAVAPISGRMDPLEARIVLHGHIFEGPASVTGALPRATVDAALAAGIAALKAELGPVVDQFHGPLCLDIGVDATGRIDEVGVLVNRLRPLGTPDREMAEVVGTLLEKLDLIAFPPSAGPTQIRFPILFGSRQGTLETAKAYG